MRNEFAFWVGASVFVILFVFGTIFAIMFYILKFKNVNQSTGGQTKPQTPVKDPTKPMLVSKKDKIKNVQVDNVHKFMEFEKIKDDMIISENGTKYTMIIQCQGINYDLMSEGEKIAVEEGFITFLNTLRYPIQLYVQTRTINLSNSIEDYNKRIESMTKEIDDIIKQLNILAKMSQENKNRIIQLENELRRKQNVYDYAKDIVYYVENMSLNKNMLQRKFYVVVSFYENEAGLINKFTREEIVELCRRELFTRCQSISSALSSSLVQSRILSSNELAEVLYMAYNRDDANLLNIKAAMESGFYRLYSTGEDLIKKKNEIIKKEIEEEAKLQAEIAIRKAIEEGKIITPEEFEKQYNDEVDNESIRYILNQKDELDPGILENAITKIIDKE